MKRTCIPVGLAGLMLAGVVSSPGQPTITAQPENQIRVEGTTATTDEQGQGTWTDPGVGGTGARFYRAVRK